MNGKKIRIIDWGVSLRFAAGRAASGFAFASAILFASLKGSAKPYASLTHPLSIASLSIPQDSIGQIIENGIIYLLYKVEPGETIFKISQKYDISTLEIREANALPNYDIEIGQILKIPEENSFLMKKYLSNIPLPQAKVFTSISKKYNITIKEIIDWNQLKDFTLPEGKSLIVGYKIENHNSNDNNPTSPNSSSNDNYVSAVQETEVKPRESEKLKNLPPSAFAYPSFDKKKNKKYYEVSEIGEIIVSQNPLLNPKKLQCLHDVVPIGKLIEITHLVTGRSVFVEVVGKKTNPNVILEVSEKVLDYLGVQNPTSFKTHYFISLGRITILNGL